MKRVPLLRWALLAIAMLVPGCDTTDDRHQYQCSPTCSRTDGSFRGLPLRTLNETDSPAAEKRCVQTTFCDQGETASCSCTRAD